MSNIFELFKKIETEKHDPKPITHIVAGLGNFGREYDLTRHNAGFMAIDLISEKLGVAINRAKFNALTAETEISGKRVLLMKPQLYMNRSGESIRDAAEFYKIAPENIIVMCDDINLDVGKLRIRRKGSDGGQKGLRDIIYQLSSDDFPRVRFGVGKKPQGADIINWVLGKMNENDREVFSQTLAKSVDIIPLILSENIEKAMCDYN